MNEVSPSAANTAAAEYDASVPPARGSRVSVPGRVDLSLTRRDPADALKCDRPGDPASRLQSSLSPIDLENLIELWRLVGVKETNPEQQRYAFARMAELVKQRSPEQIERLERERRLR